MTTKTPESPHDSGEDRERGVVDVSRTGRSRMIDHVRQAGPARRHQPERCGCPAVMYMQVGHEHAQRPVHRLGVSEELGGQAGGRRSRALADKQPEVRAPGGLLADDAEPPDLLDRQTRVGAPQPYAADPGPTQHRVAIDPELLEQGRKVDKRRRGHVLAGVQRAAGDGPYG